MNFETQSLIKIEIGPKKRTRLDLFQDLTESYCRRNKSSQAARPPQSPSGGTIP